MFRAMRHIWYKPARFLWLVLTFKADVAAWCFDSRGGTGAERQAHSKRSTLGLALSWAKIVRTERRASSLLERYAEVMPILGKDKIKKTSTQSFLSKIAYLPQGANGLYAPSASLQSVVRNLFWAFAYLLLFLKRSNSAPLLSCSTNSPSWTDTRAAALKFSMNARSSPLS